MAISEPSCSAKSNLHSKVTCQPHLSAENSTLISLKHTQGWGKKRKTPTHTGCRVMQQGFVKD